MYFKILGVLVALVVVLNAKSYENYKVYKVVPASKAQVQMLTDLRKSGFEFWNDIFSVGNDARIMVSQEKNKEFIKYSASVGINATLVISDVQKLIDAQLKPVEKTDRASFGSFTWNSYHTLTEIHNWLDELQETFPNVVETITIGTSCERRPIKGVIINFKAEREAKPLTGMIEGGIHAREWISPATVTWIIKEFLTSNDPDVRFLAEMFVWHIFPVINPDGYVYTFTTDRMWKKNRNPASLVSCNPNNDAGNGIDLNRNFDFLWMTVGASSNPCDTNFAGPSPASEAETQAISNYVLRLKKESNLLYYYAFHSFSQKILIPFSHASGADVLEVPNYGDLYEIGMRGAQKLSEKHGTLYTVGTAAEILYKVTGSSFDWVKGVAEVPIVLLFELRDKGNYGFLLPPENIIPNNEEVMSALVEMDNATRTLRYYSGTSGVTASALTIIVVIEVFFTLQ